MESEEEQCFCNNCKRNVAAANFSIHSAFCERNIFVCPKCEEPVKISEKDQHLEEYHVTAICNLCDAQLEKWLLPNHKEEVCTKRLVECKYCESSFPVDEYAVHIEFCGSRTEKCLSCRKYVMIKNKSEHDEIHLLEKQYRTKSVEDEIKQNKVNEVISKKSRTEKICEKPPENIHSMPSRIGDENTSLSDKFENKKCKKEHNLEIPAHERGAASLSQNETSKLYTKCRICEQNIPWINFNTHVPVCASFAGKCSVCGESVPNYEIKEHIRNHFEGKVDMPFKVPENVSSNGTNYMSNQSDSAKSKTYSSVVTCPYCSEVCSEDQILEHTRSCLKNIYECPLCGENVPEKDKKNHEEFQCPMLQNNSESNTSHFSRHSQSHSECPLCFKQIPEENYNEHVTLQCEQLSRVGGTHGLYAAGEDLYECVYCSEKMPQKDKTMHHNFMCKVLIESCGITLNDSYADVTKKTNHNSSKNDELSESCPTCKNTFPKERILHHKSKCSRVKEHCPFCKDMIDVACTDIHLQYCPGIDNRDHSHHNTVAQDSRSSKHKGAIPKNTSIRDMMKPRSAKCRYCNTHYNVDILPNHEGECIHMPIQCDGCGQEVILKDMNSHKCKRRKGKYQNRQLSPLKDSSEGGLWTRTVTRTKNFLGMCSEKEARNTNFTHDKHHSENQTYVPDRFERKEQLYFAQMDDPLLPCEFCQQEFPASELVLHMTGCKPDLVCYAKQDSSEKLDSKQDSRKRDSAAALKSQNIHSAYGKSNPFFAKDNSVSHDASEFIERNRKSKADELSQSCYDKKSEHPANSKNENDGEKKSLIFQSVWNVTNIRNDHLKEIEDNLDKETEETTNLNKKQKGKVLDQQTYEKHIIKSSSDNEMSEMLTFLNEEKSGSDEEYHSLPDENIEQTNSEMKASSSMNPQNIQEKQGESPLLKKMTNEEKSKEVSKDTRKSSGLTERNVEEHLRQLSAGFRFGAHKTTLPLEDNEHWDIQSEKKCKDVDEPARFFERSKNQKEYVRYSENLSDLKIGRHQSAAFLGDANINEVIDKEPDTFLVKKNTKFSASLYGEKNHTNNGKRMANLNFYSNNDTDISTVLFNELEHPKILPKEQNKEPNELYGQNISNLSSAVKEDFEYIRNYRQHLPDFKYGLETIRKHSEDNVTNVTVPEKRSDHNLNQAFTLEPAESSMKSKLPVHTVLRTGVKEVGLEERIAAFELDKKILSSGANNNVNNPKRWSGWRKKKDDCDISDSD